MKQRPDWAGAVRRTERMQAFALHRRERRQNRMRKLQDMTPEEKEEMSREILDAVQTLEGLLAKMDSPEMQAEFRHLEEERRRRFAELNGALQAAGRSLASQFAGLEAVVPAYDMEGDEFWLAFDGTRLLWFEAARGMRRWEAVHKGPLRIRTGVAHALHPLKSALAGRRWHRNSSTTKPV